MASIKAVGFNAPKFMPVNGAAEQRGWHFASPVLSRGT